ncbi:PREDICTED: uncharacterized protein LOC104606096 [Nelumbo nucifera]|uniref:Uncharacterized protein LOC104606096 n=2 Tax=Nelumbo nucifera TaxID=4432 RepID=A0A1U8ANS2_NELNU|nr:PREDICTED: uncharacterized protein LOC104606096 [Nelumbo nucifera]DAD33377.1 TPA_asm: hypothetical protein HUJ06_012228 [Nelumbo nucifera]
MLSVGSRDGRKGLALGFGVGGEMDETELEEGEACYYQDYDRSVDPDVALSYIDEKLQDVLGHFQKDFEGGVSAENLGAKFGGYGSFLPAYQRSPSILSHPRTPQKVHNYSTPRSPNNLSSEVTRQNSTVPSSSSFHARPGPASSSAAPPPVSKAPSVDNSIKRDAFLYSSRGGGESTPNQELLTKSTNPSDQKTLKVRIKVGSDNTYARRNAEIYSGLGLDISPSSSLEDSPAESGGILPQSHDTPDRSPTSILEIMTSFPVPGNLLLSPLPDSMLHLTEKEKFVGDGRSKRACKGSQDGSSMEVEDPSSVRGDGKLLGEKKMKPLEKNGRSVEVKNANVKDPGNDISSILRKEIDIETPAGRELVSNALNISILSNSRFPAGDAVKGASKASDISREANKEALKDRYFSSDFVKEEAVELISSQDLNRVEKRNLKTSSTGKVWEDKKEISHKDASFERKKDRSKDDKACDPYKVESNALKGRKDVNGGSIDPPKCKVGLKSTSHEQDGVKMPQQKEQQSSGGKRKSKGSQSNGMPPAELQKESSRVDSSAALKDKKKSTSVGEYLSKSKLDGPKLPKESGKIRETYKDLPGDVKAEPSESRTDLVEIPSKDRQKDSKFETFDKEFHTFADKTKERSSGKKTDSSLTPVTYQKTAPIIAPPSMENGLISDGASATAPPVLIQDNWVCCDKCQKWRLLPYGIDPGHLPKKWKCSMLNWLPAGMNRCNISEEETTKAVQVPLPLPGDLQGQPGLPASGLNLADLRHLDQNNQDSSLLGLSAGGKKKHGPKEANAVSQTGSMNFPNSSKKNQQFSVKSRSLNDVTQSPLEPSPANRPGFQNLSKSGDFTREKHLHKQKEKHKQEHYLDGGDVKHSNRKRESDQDGLRTSKKIKDDSYYTDEDWNSDQVGPTGKVLPCSSGGLPTKPPGKDLEKYNDCSSSKDSKYDARDGTMASVKKLKDQVLDGGTLDMGKSNRVDNATKKRKSKEWQESQIYSEVSPTRAHHPHDSRVPVKEEISENGRRKEKRLKVSNSDGKESSTSKGDGRTEKKGKVTRIILSGNRDQPVDGTNEEGISCIDKDQQQGHYRGSQRALDGVDSLKRDLGYGQTSAATTSSSSKVSGSRKTKGKFQEVKGSPVESVTSSPLRIPNPDKLISGRRNMPVKEDTFNFGLSDLGSPRRCSDGEGDWSHRSATVKKEKTSSGTNRGSLESSILDEQGKDVLSSKATAQAEPSEFGSTHLVNRGPSDQQNLVHEEERLNNNYHSNGSIPQKSGKNSSSRSKDKHRSSKSDFDKGKIKVSDSFNEQEELYSGKSSRYEAETESHHRSPYHEEMRDGKHSFQEKCSSKLDKDEKGQAVKNDHVGKWASESSRREVQSKHGGHEGSDAKLDPIGSKDGKSIPQQEREGERPSNRCFSDRIDRMEIPSGRTKSQLFPNSGEKQERQSVSTRPASGSQTGNGSEVLPVDASAGGDVLKAPKHPRKPDNQNGAHHSNVRHPTPNGIGVRDLDAPSPLRKDSSSHAAGNNALKEATDLKHTADRLKNCGSVLETTGLYFQAALKFLHGASLLECNIENIRYGEQNQSMHVYSTTAALCGFCAREYERCKEMAAASLAYKCMEVAYMKVIYFKHSTASKDRHELHTALQTVPPGESPSSSASDVDNLNHQGLQDKAALTKSTNSPHVGGNHVIVARNRPRFDGLLDFAKEAASAMEASKKSRNAFAVANAHREEGRCVEAISSVKRVLDFCFHDVEGFLRLVRLAMEAINR